MRVGTGSLPSLELVVVASRTLSCAAGELRVRFADELSGFICLLRGHGAWHPSSSSERPLAPGSVLACSADTAASVVLTTPAQLAVVSVERATSTGTLFQELYPAPTLAHFGPGAGLERLRGLLALLPQSAPFLKDAALLKGAELVKGAQRRPLPNTRTDECLLLALIWSVHEQRDLSPTDAVSDPAVPRATGILERDPTVSSALQILEHELALRLNVTALAKRVGLSRSAFVRRFSAALGLPPEKYLTWLRLQRAAQLLVTSDAGLAAIASEVGYGSEFSFSRAFRRWYGVPPGTYRKQPSGGIPRTFALAA